MKAMLGLTALAALAFAAHADPINGAIGHALKVTNATGVATTYRLASDNTYTSETASGAWRAADERLCLTPEGGAEFCLPYAEDKQVGDTWTIAGPGGRAVFTVALED